MLPTLKETDLATHAEDMASMNTLMSFQGIYMLFLCDCISNTPGRIWGPSEVVNARRAAVLRQDRHYTGCGEERFRVYADSTGFVP